jgi:hypothetical protein
MKTQLPASRRIFRGAGSAAVAAAFPDVRRDRLSPWAGAAGAADRAMAAAVNSLAFARA